MPGSRAQAGESRREDAMEQSFVHTETHDDPPMVNRPSKRARGVPKVTADKRKLKPGLY